MSQNSMTFFSRQLGAYLAGKLPLAELEAAIDRVANDDQDRDGAQALLEMHRASGRLAMPLYQTLQRRLSGEPDSHDATLPAGADEREASDGQTPLQRAAAALSSVASGDETIDIDPRDTFVPSDDDVELTRVDDLDEAPTVATPAADASAALDEAASRRGADGEATRTVHMPAPSTAMPAGESTERLVPPSSAAPGHDPTERIAPPSNEGPPHEPTERIAPPSMAGPAHEPTERIAPPSNEGPAHDPTERIAPPSSAPPGHEPTERIAPAASGHEPTERIATPAPPAYEPTERIASKSGPAHEPTERIPAPGEATVRVNAHVAPTERINQHVAPTERIAPAVDADAMAETALATSDSGLFPSQPLPTGTGSNWLRPDQWTERHKGPIGPGTILKRRFLIEKQLGRGGMGVVFKARDKRKDEAQDRDPFVAIKVLNGDFREHPQALMALQREARKAQTLAHPNIVTVYDFDRDGTTVYMTMELMRGEGMDRRLRRERGSAPDIAGARRIIIEMARGLAYAHERDIVHSDFKPGNVFLTEDGRVKILDFGIARARALSGATGAEQTLFDAGDLGSLTPAYASWEMFNRGAPHPSDDVYGLAVTAYLLLTGRHPFDRKTAEQAVELGLTPEPIKGIARHEWQAIADGLALKREDRIADAAAFLKAFGGPQRVSGWVAALVAGLAAVAAFFAYTSFQDPGPAIPWSELTLQQQADFQSFVNSGEGWLANDPPWIGGAYQDFAAAYDIHPRNPAATNGLDEVARSLIELANGAATTVEQRRVLEDIETASSNEYLEEHRELRQVRRRLTQAVNASQ